METEFGDDANNVLVVAETKPNNGRGLAVVAAEAEEKRRTQCSGAEAKERGRGG